MLPAGKYLLPVGLRQRAPSSQVSAGLSSQAGVQLGSVPPAHTLLGVFVARRGRRCRLQARTGRRGRAAVGGVREGDGRAFCARGFVAAREAGKGPWGGEGARGSLQAAHAQGGLRLQEGGWRHCWVSQ